MNPGEVWGPFRIIAYVGSGAMGDVYFARNEQEGRDVALKRVRRAPGPEGGEKLTAERSGAALEQQLSALDRRVTAVYWFGEIAGDLAIEMEYIDGEDLSAALARGPIHPGRAAVIGLELCELLENLRRFKTGVVHGDLKPKNVRVASSGEIRVMDFGVAKALSQARDYTASLFGSVAYCSPERLDTGSMDGHSDLWSVGVMLYQMIAGRLPFEGETPERLERRIRSGEPPETLPATCPAALSRIVFKTLARELRDRYPSATEAHADLERFQKGQPVTATDATVRTARPVIDDATRRTARPLPASFPFGKIVRRFAAAGAAGLFGTVIWAWLLIRPQYKAWADARDLKHEIEAEHLSAGEAWDRYQDIVHRGEWPITTWGIGGTLKSRLMAAGEVPIADFRDNDYPTSHENQWRQSVKYFSKALELDPGDKTIKSKLRLCLAHVERITASGPSRQTTLNDAVEKFREAADLSKHSPDPYIGLARLYAYNIGDCERAQDALNHAARNGHPATRREELTLADAYLRRGTQSLRDSQRFTETPGSERDYLKHASDDLERARGLYSKLGSFSKAPDNLLAAIRAMSQLELRRSEMETVNR